MPGFAEQYATGDVVQAVIDVDGKQRVQIRGGSYFFTPNHIIVKVNVPVALSIMRESGIVPHTFVMKIPESRIMLDESLSTEARTIEFTPTAVGKYEFYCRNKLPFFRSHEEKGMKGVFEVIP
ncbi:MAG: quinol oxidase [Nitrosomonadaceae bacterium]|nr:quinol oxidase [Nitrosomonadaceae bacterium]